MSTLRKFIISTFIFFNLVCMLRVFAPLDTKFFQALYRPIDSYLSFFSLYQDWMMFAPNPGRTNNFLTANVEFHDGTMQTYFFPRPWDLSLNEKYVFGEKYRKLISEGIRKNNNSFMWKDTARFVLRKIREGSSDKIPLKVHLIRHWNEIPDITKEFRPHDKKESAYQTHKFYTYEVI